MSAMNHRRPQFLRQEMWVKHDQYESPKARRDRQRPESKRYAKLDPLLLSYGDTDERMLAIQVKRQDGEELSNGDQAWAFEKLRHNGVPSLQPSRARWQDADGSPSDLGH